MASPDTGAVPRRSAVEAKPALRWDGERWRPCDEAVIAECPVALLFNGEHHAVMMATPSDIMDFAVGFALAEGIVRDVGEIGATSLADVALGLEVDLAIPANRAADLAERRRSMAGGTACGLCGIISIERALRPLPQVGHDVTPRPEAITRALASLADGQALNRGTGAVHAAAWVAADGTIRLIREDVGRHTALDKLIGAVARQGGRPSDGFLLITSRCSAEMVQKAVTVGFELLVAVSGPTALALELARTAGLTLVAYARGGRFNVYTHPERLTE